MQLTVNNYIDNNYVYWKLRIYFVLWFYLQLVLFVAVIVEKIYCISKTNVQNPQIDIQNNPTPTAPPANSELMDFESEYHAPKCRTKTSTKKNRAPPPPTHIQNGSRSLLDFTDENDIDIYRGAAIFVTILKK